MKNPSIEIRKVIFDADSHKYYYDGKELNGVTKAIGRLLGKNFPDTVVVQASTIYGHDVHSESEQWIKERREPSTEAGKWIVEILKDFAQKNNVISYGAEVIVSDFEGTASCVDIVAYLPCGRAYLFDIKTTSHFDRTYCSLQLSVYKRLFELCYGLEVIGMYVIGTKSKRLFKILEQDKSRVDKILSMNKENVK